MAVSVLAESSAYRHAASASRGVTLNRDAILPLTWRREASREICVNVELRPEASAGVTERLCVSPLTSRSSRWDLQRAAGSDDRCRTA